MPPEMELPYRPQNNISWSKPSFSSSAMVVKVQQVPSGFLIASYTAIRLMRGKAKGKDEKNMNNAHHIDLKRPVSMGLRYILQVAKEIGLVARHGSENEINASGIKQTMASKTKHESRRSHSGLEKETFKQQYLLFFSKKWCGAKPRHSSEHPG